MPRALLVLLLSLLLPASVARAAGAETPIAPKPVDLAASAADPYLAPVPPRVIINLPYVGARIGQSFAVRVSLEPPSRKAVDARFERDANFAFEQQSVRIPPGGEATVVVKTLGTGVDGLPWLRATAPGYEAGNAVLNAGFIGHLKLNATGRLSNDDWSTITLSLVDKDGKSFPNDKLFDVILQSTDAELGQPGNGELRLRLLRNANVLSFPLKPKRLRGGEMTVNAMLSVDSIPDFSLDTQSMTLQAEPAWWLPLLLAIVGGLIYGVYRVVQPTDAAATKRFWVPVIGGALAGVFGYLIANLDLLGLKLDPNSLRSYPLLGFLVSYIGLDPLLQKAVPARR